GPARRRVSPSPLGGRGAGGAAPAWPSAGSRRLQPPARPRSLVPHAVSPLRPSSRTGLSPAGAKPATLPRSSHRPRFLGTERAFLAAAGAPCDSHRGLLRWNYLSWRAEATKQRRPFLGAWVPRASLWLG